MNEAEKPRGVKRKAKEERKKAKGVHPIRQRNEFSRMVVKEAKI